MDFMCEIDHVKLSQIIWQLIIERNPLTIELLLVLYSNTNLAKLLPQERMLLFTYNLISSPGNRLDCLKLKISKQTLDVRVEQSTNLQYLSCWRRPQRFRGAHPSALHGTTAWMQQSGYMPCTQVMLNVEFIRIHNRWCDKAHSEESSSNMVEYVSLLFGSINSQTYQKNGCTFCHWCDWSITSLSIMHMVFAQSHCLIVFRS